MSKYHPKRADREITDIQEIESILSNGKYAVIAMANDNEPYIVSISYGYDKENQRLYFHCAMEGEKLEFIRKNENVCATIIEDGGYVKDNCEHLFSSLIIRGKMTIVTDLDEKKHGLDVLLHHLEDDPDPIKARNIKNDSSYDKVVILRLKMDSIVGKRFK